jgi:putative ABC transport system permease protein
MTAPSRSVRMATAIYRTALRALPRDFRERYSAELESVFRDIATAARRRGVFAVANVTFRSLLDLASGGPGLHARAAHGHVTAPGGTWMNTWHDVRYAARRLRRRPGFTMVSAVTLALGVAATTSVFTLIHGVILNPLPYPESDRLVQVDHGGRGVGLDRGLGVTVGFYRFYRDNVRSAEAMASYWFEEQTLTGAGDPVQLDAVRATPSLERVLRIPTRTGRWFSEADGKEGAAPTVVLSEALWRERFAGEPSVVGRAIQLNGSPVVVIGVMPSTFAFPNAQIRMWLPAAIPTTHIGGWGQYAVARLGTTATPATLEQELVSLLPRLREDPVDPAKVASYLDEAKVFPRIVPLKDALVGDVRLTLWVLMGTVGFVLLIAVANVTNLFLVRAEEGHRDVIVRAALGAGRSRLVRAALAESMLLALGAGVLGLLLAAVAVRLLRLNAPVNIPRLHEIGLQPEVIGVALSITLLVGILLGLIPSLARRVELGTAIKEVAGRATSSRGRLVGRNTLVAAQVALALVLLIGSGLLLRTYAAMRAVPLGFSERNALVFETGLPWSRYASRADAKSFQDRLSEKLVGLPGVTSAGAVGQCLPLVGYMCYGEVLEVEGRPNVEGKVPPVTGVRIATTEYFRTIGIAVRGRSFTPGDESGQTSVVVLSAAAARAYFGDEDPIGRRVRFARGMRDAGEASGDWSTVVGVAADVRVRIQTDDFQRIIYFPILPQALEGPSAHRMSWVLATTLPPTSLVPAVRAALDELDPGLPLAQLRTLQGVINEATAPAAFSLTLVALAASIALLLGAVGVYAVIAYAVSRRTAEIGVRLALGARAADVRWMVLRQGGSVVLAGIGVGLVGAVLLTRALRAMLFGVSPTDVPSYVVLTAVMLLVALAALYLPARRASKVDPMEALRGE